MTAVVSKLPRNRLFVGEDKTLRFTVDHDSGDTPGTWTLSFVVRYASTTCPGREDPGDGALVFSKATADMTVTVVTSTTCRIEVPIERDDTVDLTADDYYAALWRTDDGNDRPLHIFRYLHLTAVAKQTS